jgi:hypothetical protein
MVLPSSNTPLEQAMSQFHKEVAAEFVNLRQQLSSASTSLATQVTQAVNDLNIRGQDDRNQVLASVDQQAAALKNEILTEVRKKKDEGKGFQIFLVILPVALGLWVWYLQLGTNERIDTNGKRVATALALRAESYKRKITVYEDADKQMAALVSVMQDLLHDANNPRKLKLAADTQAKLTEMSQVNGLYITKEVSKGLSNVAYTAATKPADLQALTDQVQEVEQEMRKELESDFQSFGTEK